MNVLASLFGNYSKRELKRIQPFCDRVLMKEDTYKDMTDEELTAQTGVLKDRLAGTQIHTEILGSDHCPVELQIKDRDEA